MTAIADSEQHQRQKREEMWATRDVVYNHLLFAAS